MTDTSDFELTEIQRAYLLGRQATSEPQSSAHLYMEFESRELDLARLQRAWQAVVARHDMLRAVVTRESRQRVLPEVPCDAFAVDDLSALPEAERGRALLATRERMSREVRPAGAWPLWEVRATRLGPERLHLHWRMDLLTVDAGSMGIVLRDWKRAYEAPERALPLLPYTFAAYLDRLSAWEPCAAARRSEEIARALEELPPGPELPLIGTLETLRRVKVERRSGRLGAADWARLSACLEQHALTPASFLCALYAEVLRRWSKTADFALNVTSGFRLPLHPAVRELVGDFTSTHLLRAEPCAGPFVRRATALRRRLLEHAVAQHRAPSGVQLTQALARRSGQLGAAVMPVVFTSTLGPRGLDADDFSFLGRNVCGLSQTPHVCLDHIVMQEAGGVCFHWDAAGELFAPGVLDAMFSDYEDALARCVRDEGTLGADRLWRPIPLPEPKCGLSASSGLARSERGARGTELLHSGFLRQARERPDARAIWSPERCLSYGEVLELAERVAARLAERGVGHGALVGIVMHKGWEQVVACLGVLLAGAAYVPIDAALPRARIAYLFQNSGLRSVLTQPTLVGSFDAGDDLPVLVVSDALPRAEAAGAAPAEPGDLAYVIYTSGSTGQPKGVMITHAAAVNTCADINRRFALGAGDVIFGLSALSFDLSVYDVFGTLAAGACLALPSADEAKDPQHWALCLEQAGVTLWNSVPALLGLLLDQATIPRATALRTILLSGDWIPLDLPGRARAIWPAADIVSLGGATEASIWSILYRITSVDPAWRSIPYGHALDGQSVYVLDHELELRPPHVVGELYIGGVGLARGYFRDTEKTARAFVTHPRTGQRLYRTGDFGRYLPDGNIEFMGREDTQVKVHGHRIECGEIEARLRACPGVAAAVVLALGAPREERRLAAFVCPCPESPPPEPGSLRAWLGLHLPHYMIPLQLLVCRELPLTPNGKVDRQALCSLARGALDAPALGAAPGPEPASPAAELTPAQARVVGIVARVLGRPNIGVRETLFDLGADSLHAIRIVRELKQTFAIDISLRRLAARLTLEEIAREVEPSAERAPRSPEQPKNIGGGVG